MAVRFGAISTKNNNASRMMRFRRAGVIGRRGMCDDSFVSDALSGSTISPRAGDDCGGEEKDEEVIQTPMSGCKRSDGSQATSGPIVLLLTNSLTAQTSGSRIGDD